MINKYKKSIIIVMCIILLISCTIYINHTTKTKIMIDDKIILENGYFIIKEAMNNLDIDNYSVNLKSSFFKDLNKEYKLTSKQLTFIKLVKNFAKKYNKFKETNNDYDILNITNSLSEIKDFMKINYNKE